MALLPRPASRGGRCHYQAGRRRDYEGADGLIIALRSHEVGEKVEITLMRGKEEKKVTVELGSDEELQNQQQDDSATDTGNGGITDEQLRQYLEELLGQQGRGQN